MRQKSRKLRLSRETLRDLDNSRLRVVAGGVTLACSRQACSEASYCFQCASYEYTDCPGGCTMGCPTGTCSDVCNTAECGTFGC
jgi:hypothetical protein